METEIEKMTLEERTRQEKAAEKMLDEAFSKYKEIEKKIEDDTKEDRAKLKSLSEKIENIEEYITRLDVPVYV